MVIIQLAAPVGNMKHSDWQPERARGHWITREKRTRPMFTHLDLTFGQITHTYLPKLGSNISRGGVENALSNTFGLTIK